MSYITPMETKSAAEMLKKFKEFKAEVENQLSRKIKCLRTNGGGEYKKTFEKYLKENGIVHETIVPYSLDQNDVSERANRTIMDRLRLYLHRQKTQDSSNGNRGAIVYLLSRAPPDLSKARHYMRHGLDPCPSIS